MNGLRGLKQHDIVVFNYPQVSGCIALRSTMCCGRSSISFTFRCGIEVFCFLENMLKVEKK